MVRGWRAGQRYPGAPAQRCGVAGGRAGTGRAATQPGDLISLGSFRRCCHQRQVCQSPPCGLPGATPLRVTSSDVLRGEPCSINSTSITIAHRADAQRAAAHGPGGPSACTPLPPAAARAAYRQDRACGRPRSTGARGGFRNSPATAMVLPARLYAPPPRQRGCCGAAGHGGGFTIGNIAARCALP